MTKRIIALAITLIMLLSAVTIIEVGAVNHAPDKDYLFLDDFDAKHGVYKYPDSVNYYYDELYYHYVDENDPNSEIDWAIVYALAYATSEMGIKTIVADRVLATRHDAWYGYGWALYDAETKDFVAIDKVDLSKYEGFVKGLEEAKIGNPLGDANLDGELTVLDATYIQRALAGLCEFDSRDDLSEYLSRNADIPLDYISDMDGDGERSIFDATAIQMKLAKVEDTVVE